MLLRTDLCLFGEGLLQTAGDGLVLFHVLPRLLEVVPERCNITRTRSVFKILNGYENVDRNIFFTVEEERTRGHGVTLAKKQCRLDIINFS